MDTTTDHFTPLLRMRAWGNEQKTTLTKSKNWKNKAGSVEIAMHDDNAVTNGKKRPPTLQRPVCRGSLNLVAETGQ